ncbi:MULTISPECIES: hypothetical protein [Citromicrobium]|uniref:hypothetical protein n=1 Tax=Citromicrobium TaxID=72173 RepID=UPI0001DD10BC|nr:MULTISPECIES: hypothetical protein [Citromicrobium]ALG60910.1 hypothetical protein WG74_08740 [Citromicrobium sp. JL477]
MGAVYQHAQQVYRDFTTDGVQTSGLHAPTKSDIRELFQTVDNAISAAQAGLTAVADVSARDSFFATAANQNRLVYVNDNNGADDDPANGVYEYVDGAARLATGFYQGVALVVQPLVDEAEAWAQGTEPGGTGTKSAKEWAQSIAGLVSLDVNDNAFAAGAGNGSVSGSGNTAFAYHAARDLLAGIGNTDFGRGAGRGNLNGEYNLNAAHSAGLLITGGDFSVRLGYLTQGNVVTVSSRNAIVGAYGAQYYQGNEFAGLGFGVGSNLTTGVRFAGLGAGAGGTATVNDAVTALGWGADISAAARDAGYNNMTAVGALAICTNENQVALGDNQVTEIRAFNMIAMRGIPAARSWYAGNAGNNNAANQGCFGIGEGVLWLSTSSSNVLGWGDLCLANHEGSNGVISLGNRSMQESIDIKDSVVLGVLALNERQHGVGFTIAGYRAQQHGVTSNNVSAFGDSAAWQYQGDGGVFGGYVVAELMQTGDGVVIQGRAAARHRKNGDHVILIGEWAGGFPDAAGVDIEANLGAVTAGDRVVGIGQRAIMQAVGSDIVAMGDLAGSAVTLGTGSIFIGSGAGAGESQKPDIANAIVIGTDTDAANDNEIVLGNASHTTLSVCGVSFAQADLTNLKDLSDNATELLALLDAA